MSDKTIDLVKEQEASLARPRDNYSLAARFFFLSMDLVTGSKVTLAKTKLIEMLASIPYREWEICHYVWSTIRYRNAEFVERAKKIISWGRHAQDNEYFHLLVINEKMKEDGIRDPWYLFPLIPFMMILSYVVFEKVLALFSIRRAFLFNAEFEDHAEHVYAQFVKDHPEWESQPVTNPLVQEYAAVDTWADVFRRIGLDERDHRNESYAFAGKPDCVVPYDGMPQGR